MSTDSTSAPPNPSQPGQAAFSALRGGRTFQQSDVPSQAGRTAIVTGGTDGIGYQVARALAIAGAHVVIISRKAEHGKDAIDSMIKFAAEQATAVSKEPVPIDVEFVECDFGNLANVREVADKLRKDKPRIDILVNDAGIGVDAQGFDSDNIERAFGINVLGHFLFINRLLPLIRKTASEHKTHPPRIVSLSSDLHKLAPSDVQFKSLEEINKTDLRADQYYNRSKLAIILYIKALVERALTPSPEKIYALSTHPGAVDTKIQDQPKAAFGDVLGTALKYAQMPLMRTAEQGSLSTLWAATSPEVEEENVQGAYVKETCEVGGETDQAKDQTLQDNVWTLCTRIVHEKLGPKALLPWDASMTTADQYSSQA